MRSSIIAVLAAFAIALISPQSVEAAQTLNGVLDAGDPTWTRVFGVNVGLNCDATSTISDATVDIPYDTHRIVLTSVENFTAEIVAGAGTDVFDPYIFLYCDPFDPMNPQTNLVAADDDGGTGLLSAFTDGDGLALNVGQVYVLVVSLFNSSGIGGGNYELSLGGSAFAADMTVEKTDLFLIDTDVDGRADIGDRIIYSVSITNNGTTVTQNSRLVDVPDPSTGLLIGSVTTDQGTVILGNGAGNTSVEIDIGEILPMGTVIVEFEATVTSLNTDSGFISNQAIYSDDLSPSIPSNNPFDPDNFDTRTPVDIPNMTAEKSAVLNTDVDMDGKAGANDVIEYTININNMDDDMGATGATLIDFPDANTTLVVGSVTAPQGTVISGNTAGDTSVQVDFGSIAPLGSVSVTFEVAMPALVPDGVAQISNQGMVTGSNFPDLLTDDPATMAESDPTITPVTPQISFETPNSLQILEDGTTIPSGDTITLLRSGDLSQSSDVVVTITGGTATGGPAPGGTDYNNSAFPSAFTFNAGQATKTVPLPIFEDSVIEMTETILLSVAPSVNGVIGSTSTFTVNILDNEISATKNDTVTGDADGDGIADPGDVVRFTVVVTNNGISDLEFTSFTDTPGTQVTDLVVGSVTTSQGVVLSGNSGGDTEVDINLGTISPMGMGSATITYDVLVSNTVPDNLLSVFNQGTVRAGVIDDLATDDPDTTERGDATETFFDRGGEATFTKTFILSSDVDCNLRVSAGDTVTYFITFSTAGDSPLLGGTVTDDLGDFSTLIVGSVALSGGTVVKGNTSGDTTIEVTDFTATPGLDSLLIYSVLVDSAPSPGINVISNQAMISGANFGTILSDDPTTPAPDDPTVITMNDRFGTTEFFSSSAGAPIPFLATTDFAIIVSGVDTYLWDINLQTFIQDIEFRTNVTITLISPTGIESTIVSKLDEFTGGAVPGFENLYNGTIWDDDAGDILAPGPVTDATIQSGVPLATAVPEEALGAFRGIDPNGTWTLRIDNTSASVSATLASWELEVTTLPSAPTPSSSVLGSSPALAILDNTTIEDTITFSGLSNVICNVRVQPFITHTFAADLEIFLTSPSGTEVTLTTDNGGGNNNVFNGTIFQDDAGVANPPGPATDNTYANLVVESPLVPEEAMSAFNGEDPNGIWTLRVRDDAALDIGIFSSWALELTTCDPPGDPEAYGVKIPIQFVNDIAPLGFVNIGDTVRYVVQVRNIGRGTAETITFSDPLSSQFALVEGSVETSQGVVTQGNDPGDVDIQVNVGDIAADCSLVTITFDLLLVGPADIFDIGTTEPNFVPVVTNQGTIVGSNFPATMTDANNNPDDGLEPSRLLISASGPNVSASKVDALQVDVGMDGLFNEGDTVRYTVTITNDGDTNVGGATYTSPLDPNSTLLTGSVTTTQGTITTGNTASDTSVAIDLGSLVGFGGTVTITYDVTINGSLPVEVMGLSCQGEIDGNNIDTVRTDDPAWPGPADPTITPIGSEDLASTVRIIEFLLGRLNDPRGLDVNGDGAIDAADVVFSKTQLEPIAASGPMPANGATSVPIDTTFSWTDPDMRSDTFQFALSLTSGGPAIDEFLGLTTPQATPSADLEFSTTYDWVVISFNSAGAVQAEDWTFTTEAVPVPLPGPVSSPSPSDALTGVGIGAFLQWTAGTDATSYDLFLWPSADPQPGTPTGADIMDTSFNPDLVAGTAYSWQVNAKNATGQTAGPIWTFTTAP